ncbi:hypothetical protein EBR03_04935 [bacterium]|nr:hypothetical protein [bacterium]NBX81654.1 hypothetical protein [bacterium]
MKPLFLILTCLLTQWLFADSVESWEQLLQKSNSEKVSSWQNWIASQGENHIQSPEAYFNLAQAFWEADEVAPTVEALFQSIQWENNPVKILEKIQLISDIQRVLADHSSPIDSFGLRLSLLYNSAFKNFLGILFTLAVTCFLLLQFGVYQTSRYRWIPLSLMFLSLILIGILELNQKRTPIPVVLDNNKLPVILYNSPSESQEVVADLPSGLLVTPENLDSDWISIQHPLGGWISKKESRKLAFTSAQWDLSGSFFGLF